MYRRVGTDHLFRDEEGRLYALEIASPAEYELRSDAAKDCTRYRFERRNGEVLLMAYKSSLNLIEDDGAGRKIFKNIPVGKPIAAFTEKEFLQDELNKIKRYVPETERQAGHLLSDEFREVDDVSFEGLFPDLQEGKSIYISQGENSYIASGRR